MVALLASMMVVEKVQVLAVEKEDWWVVELVVHSAHWKVCSKVL